MDNFRELTYKVELNGKFRVRMEDSELMIRFENPWWQQKHHCPHSTLSYHHLYYASFVVNKSGKFQFSRTNPKVEELSSGEIHVYGGTARMSHGEANRLSELRIEV